MGLVNGSWSCSRSALARKRLAAALLAAGLLAAEARAQTWSATCQLDGPQVVPPTISSATGTAAVSLDPFTGTLTVSGTYSGLMGTQLLAHVHRCPTPFNSNGQTMMTLTGTGGTSGTFSGSAAFGSIPMSEFRRGLFYVDVHSAMFPGGEIRGQIVNIQGSTELGTDPTLVDSGGDPARGPRIAHATETFNVALDCSNAGAPGPYVIWIRASSTNMPLMAPHGFNWMSGATLITSSGAHSQNVVTFSPGSGTMLPADPTLVGVSYCVQGFCRDPANPLGRLSAALIQVIEM